ncbi:MAG: putative rane protein [Thermomicrobiales bacterium]|nr:putative rane protein [Thermomicrobiales bacterium]
MADGSEQRLHPAWIILRAVATLRAMVLPLAVVLFTGRSTPELLGFGIAGLFVVGTIATRAAAWWRFTYSITPQGLRVRSGLLSRQDRLMPFERIQSVDLREGVLERLFRVAQVRIESAAGGGGADVILGAVSREKAAEIRDVLLRGRASVQQPPVPVGEAMEAPFPPTLLPTHGEPIFTMSLRALLVAGATSSRVGPALAILAGAFQFADDLLPEEWWEELANSAPAPTVGVLVALAVAAMLCAWILATVSTVLTFGGFELRREGDRLLISHGLLERRRSTIPIARIQAVTVSEGWLRQPFGLAAVRVESAGYGSTSGESGVLAPLIRLADLPVLLKRACPAYALDQIPPPLQPLPPRAKRRYVLANVWLVLGVTGLLTVLTRVLPWSPWWWGITPLALLPLAAAFGLLQHRDTGWNIEGAERLILRMRGVDRLTAITLRQRLQERSISQQPLQRRAGLATFHTAVASGGSGGRFALVHMDATAAFELMGRLGPRMIGRRPAPPNATTLTTVQRDHDDSSVEFRTSLLPARHDGGEGILDCDRPT